MPIREICGQSLKARSLIPLSVIPVVRITDKRLVTVPGMQIVPLFELR